MGGAEGVSLPVLADDWLEDLCLLAEADARDAADGGDDDFEDLLDE